MTTAQRLPARLAPARRLFDRAFPRGAILLSVLTFGGYLVGLLRDRTFARTFGAGSELDAYNAAFALPELLLDVLVASGLTAPFVPVLLGLRSDDDATADDFARTAISGAILVMAVTSAILFVIAPWTATFIAPGFDAATRELYVSLFRVMCLTTVIFAASIGIGEMLVAERRFLAFGLSPLLYNLGIVVCTLLFASRIGIYAAAVGAVVGAVLHLAVRVVGVRRTSFRFRPRLAVHTPAFREFFRLMVPKMISQPIEPITFLFFTAVATTLVAGSVSSVSFARNFASVPVGLIGASFSLAVFPPLSAAYAAGDRRRFGALIGANLATIGVLTTISAVGLFVLGPIVIDLFLGGGAFDAEDVARTSLVLGVFCLAVPLESLIFPLSRALYATHNTVLQVVTALIGLAVIVGSCLALVDGLGVVAIPLSFALGSATKVVLLGVAVAWRLRTAPGLAGPGTAVEESLSPEA